MVFSPRLFSESTTDRTLLRGTPMTSGAALTSAREVSEARGGHRAGEGKGWRGGMGRFGLIWLIPFGLLSHILRFGG